LKATYLHLLILLLAGWPAGNGLAQSLLEARISLRATNVPVEEVLRQIGDKGGFSFSYSPDAIDVRARVSVQAVNQSVREILTEVFKGSVTFRERRKYIILQPAATTGERKPDVFYLNGYVTDQATGERLPDVSIYEAGSLVSTVSNQYGYYRLRLPVAQPTLRLEVRKETYGARSVDVTRRQDYTLPIQLSRDTVRHLVRPTPRVVSRSNSALVATESRIVVPVVVPPPLPEPDTTAPGRRREKGTLKDQLQQIRDDMVEAFASTRQAIHTENITDTLYRPFQASILPYVGTNNQLSGQVINDVSLNLIAGYSLGVGALEVGGLVNLVRGDVQGIQAAGLANLVGRHVSGIQIGGFGNLTIGNFEGIQLAGTVNATADHFFGVQVSGGANLVGSTLNGWQVSPGLNYAHRVQSGRQVGFINYTDSSATTPFGYFSYVRRNGYRRLDLSTDELTYANVAFKTGVAAFYNIFSVGLNGFLPGKPVGSIGYGLGTARQLGRGWMLNGDLSAHRLAVQRRFWQQPRVGHYRLTVAVEKKLTDRLALSVGPTLNLIHSRYRGLMDTGTRPGPEPIWIGNAPAPGSTTYSWVGFQAALRICNRTY
jgi:hypothetical protein